MKSNQVSVLSQPEHNPASQVHWIVSFGAPCAESASLQRLADFTFRLSSLARSLKERKNSGEMLRMGKQYKAKEYFSREIEKAEVSKVPPPSTVMYNPVLDLFDFYDIELADKGFFRHQVWPLAQFFSGSFL